MPGRVFSGKTAVSSIGQCSAHFSGFTAASEKSTKVFVKMRYKCQKNSKYLLSCRLHVGFYIEILRKEWYIIGYDVLSA